VDGKTSSRQLVEHNLVGTVNLLELARNWNGLPDAEHQPCLLDSHARHHSGGNAGDRFTPPANAGTISGLGPRGVRRLFHGTPLSLYRQLETLFKLLACEYADAFGLPCGSTAAACWPAGQFGKIDQGIFSF